MQNKKNIAVIVGAGLATRLKPISDVIPKVLINHGHHTILKNLVDLYSQNYSADEIILILPSKFIEITKGYMDYMSISGVQLVACDEPLGSAFAISKIFDQIEGHNVVFNWSDITPNFDNFTWDTDAIYTYGNECRYNFNNGLLHNVGLKGGNVVGVYQVKEFKRYNVSYSQPVDFVDIYNFDNFEKIDLQSMTDIGDFVKLVNAHKELPICRSFNQVEFKGDIVVKTAIGDQGVSLQCDEVNWYSHVTNENKSDIKIPGYNHIPETDTLILSRVNGRMLSDCTTDDLFDSYIDTLLSSSLSDKVPHDRNDVLADYEKEFKTKIIDRCQSIDGLLKNFSHIKYVNGQTIFPLEKILDKAWEEIKDSVDCNYEIIHGDPNFSNILVDEKTDLWMIDPRGYFGFTEIYGPKDYDIAKILYALSGYDGFNRQPDWAGLSVNHNGVFLEIQPLRPNWTKDPRFKRHHHIMVALIWIALAGYFKNNPYKAIASYFHGLVMLSNLFKSEIRTFTDNNGEQVSCLASSHPVLKSIVTKFPEKWLLVDRETGEQYEMSSTSDMYTQWKKI